MAEKINEIVIIKIVENSNSFTDIYVDDKRIGTLEDTKDFISVANFMKKLAEVIPIEHAKIEILTEPRTAKGSLD